MWVIAAIAILIVIFLALWVIAGVYRHLK